MFILEFRTESERYICMIINVSDDVCQYFCQTKKSNFLFCFVRVDGPICCHGKYAETVYAKKKISNPMPYDFSSCGRLTVVICVVLKN